MKSITLSIAVCMNVLFAMGQAPSRVNPVIKSQGGIFEIPYAVEKPDPSLMYNIVIEVEREGDSP